MILRSGLEKQMEMCIRDRYDSVFKYIFNPEAKPERLSDLLSEIIGEKVRVKPVSYTHLDVYKRQFQCTIICHRLILKLS